MINSKAVIGNVIMSSLTDTLSNANYKGYKRRLLPWLLAIASCIVATNSYGTDVEVKTQDPRSGAELEGSVKSSKNPITGTKTVVKESKVKKKRADGDTAEISRTEKTKTSKEGDTKTIIIEEGIDQGKEDSP
jgi:hypothetical protein